MSRIATTTDVLLALIIAGLAAARVWQFLAGDSLTMRLRVWLADHQPRVLSWVLCPWCSGFWYAAGLYLLIYYVSDAGIWVGLVAAAKVAAVASLLGTRLGGDGES